MSPRTHDSVPCMVVFTVAVLLALSIGAAGNAQAGALPPRADDAAQALAEQRYADAEAAYRARLIEDPTSLLALRGWAEALIGLGRGGEASGSLRRAAEAALSRGDYSAAVQLLELALLASPKDTAVEARLGMALMLDRRFTAAEIHLRSVWQAGVRGPRELLYFAACLWENGRLEESEARYREAIEQSGGSAMTQYELGRLLLWQGRAQEAAELIQRALERGQVGFGPRLDLARALERMARDDPESALEAIEAYRAAVQLAPEYSQVHYGLARALLQAGRRDEAEAELILYRRLQAEEQALGREQRRSEARSAWARELIGQGREEEARALLEGLPDLPEVWHARAVLRRSQGDLQGAIEALQRALALDGERSDLAALLVELQTVP